MNGKELLVKMYWENFEKDQKSFGNNFKMCQKISVE